MLLPHARKWLHEWIPCTIITWAAGTEKFTLKKNLVHQVQVLTPCFSSCKQHLQRGFQTLTRWSKAFYNLLNSWSANWSSYLQGKETGAHQLGTRLFSSTTFGTGHSQVAQFLAMWNIMVSCHASNNKRLFTTQRYSCGSLGGKNAGKMFPYDEWLVIRIVILIVLKWSELMSVLLLLKGYSAHPAFQGTCSTLPLKDGLWVFTCSWCAAVVEYPESLFIWNKKWAEWALYSCRVEECTTNNSKSLHLQV